MTLPIQIAATGLVCAFVCHALWHCYDMQYRSDWVSVPVATIGLLSMIATIGGLLWGIWS